MSILQADADWCAQFTPAGLRRRQQWCAPPRRRRRHLGLDPGLCRHGCPHQRCPDRRRYNDFDILILELAYATVGQFATAVGQLRQSGPSWPSLRIAAAPRRRPARRAGSFLLKMDESYRAPSCNPMMCVSHVYREAYARAAQPVHLQVC